MPFRFRRSIRVLPGVRINIGKRGVSTSIGVKGAHITIGHGRVRETIGLPGSGISYSHQTTRQEARAALPPRAPSVSGVWMVVMLIALAGWVAYLITRHG